MLPLQKKQAFPRRSPRSLSTLPSIPLYSLKNDEKVQLVGFGSFETKHRAERTGRNPKTKESITIAASKVPTFKAGKAFKDAVAE